jgi:hypothetical protein
MELELQSGTDDIDRFDNVFTALFGRYLYPFFTSPNDYVIGHSVLISFMCRIIIRHQFISTFNFQ